MQSNNAGRNRTSRGPAGIALIHSPLSTNRAANNPQRKTHSQITRANGDRLFLLLLSYGMG